jgi:predicted DCC family thiol-disulfide oxidoreductase YuxK
VAGTPILIFDGDCAFCTTSARWLQRKLASRAPVEPWQFTDLPAYGITAERAQYEVLWVDATGLYGGAQAFAHWLIDSGGLWRIVGRLITLPPIRWVAAGVYRLIANNRNRMPGGTPDCALPQAQRPPQTQRQPQPQGPRSDA